MSMFDRDELIPLLYNVGDKVMGHHNSVGIDMLVGGKIIETRQSTSHLNNNSYQVELEPELCEEGKTTWWINEKEVKPFKQDVWNKAVKHWKEHLKLKEKSYMEYLRVFIALRGDNDEIGDEELQNNINLTRFTGMYITDEYGFKVDK